MQLSDIILYTIQIRTRFSFYSVAQSYPNVLCEFFSASFEKRFVCLSWNWWKDKHRLNVLLPLRTDFPVLIWTCFTGLPLLWILDMYWPVIIWWLVCVDLFPSPLYGWLSRADLCDFLLITHSLSRFNDLSSHLCLFHTQLIFFQLLLKSKEKL